MTQFKEAWDYIFRVVNPSALILFLLALLVGFIGKQINLWRRMRNNQAFLIFWVNQIGDPVKKQALAIKRFGETLKDPDTHPASIMRFNLHIDKLKVLTPLDMVQTFINNKKYYNGSNDKLLYRISSEMDLLDRIQQANDDNLKICIDMGKDYQNEWEKNIHGLHDWFSETAKEKGLQSNEYLVALFKIYEECGKKFENVSPENVEPLKWTKEYLIDKIELVTENYKNYSGRGPYMNDLMKYVLGLKVTYERRRLNIGGFGERFIESGTNMEASYDRLKLATDNIVSSKFKWWFFLN